MRELKFGISFATPSGWSTRFALCVLVFLIQPGFSSALYAQTKLTEGQWRRGYHGANMICQGIGFDFKTSGVDFADTVFVFLGDPRRTGNMTERIVSREGSILMAVDKDQPTAMRQLGVQFRATDNPVLDLNDAFMEFPDCPIVTNIQQPYDVLDGVDYLVTNRPGILHLYSNSPLKRLAYLPPLDRAPHGNAFAACGELKNGARVVCFADQSIFSNQMLMHGDNALAFKQSLEWLANGKRKTVCLIVNGNIVGAVDPTDLDVKLPEPTREEVVDALKDLPPSAMLEFLNSVLGAVEEEGMANDFINRQLDKVREPVMNRFLIFVTFGIMCFVAMATYITQKKLKRTTVSDIALQAADFNRKKDKYAKKTDASKSKLSFERQMAVLALLDSFCLEFANRRFDDLFPLPAEFNLGDDPQSQSIENAMRTIAEDYRSKPRAFWTEKRLLGVERSVNHWRQYLKGSPADPFGRVDAEVEFQVVEAEVVDPDP